MKPLYIKKHSKYNWLKIIIYLIIIVLAVLAYFFFTKKATSYTNELDRQSQELAQDIGSNYLKILSDSKDDALTLGLTGETLVKKGFPKMGILTLEEAIKRGAYRDLYLYTATVYFSQGDITKALEYAESAKKLDPINPPTYELLAQIYTARGDAENAEICYNKSKEFKGEK